MLLPKLAAGSLAKQFAFAAAALATVAVLLTALSSWWLVSQQHKAALRVLTQKEAEFHAATVSATLHAVFSRMSEVANSSILATGLVDSAGRETYLTPYLHSIKQINGVAIQILFTDFEGQEISTNGSLRFNERELVWLKQQLEAGKRSATLLEGPWGLELLAVELLSYSRTQTPEGALLYKFRLDDLRPTNMVQLGWKVPILRTDSADRLDAVVIAPVDTPPIFNHLDFYIIENPQSAGSKGLAPPYTHIFFIAFALAGTVLILGARMALALTRDLQKLEGFSRSVMQHGLRSQRAEPSGSTEVASLARSINHMLDRLYEQQRLLEDERQRFHQLANTIPQLAWIADGEGRIHWYNDRWYEYTGTTPEQMQGAGWHSVHDPRTVSQVLEKMHTCIATGEPFQMTFPLRGADGKFRPFFTSAAPLRDAKGRIVQWFGTNTDLSALKKAEQAVRESEERLQEGLRAARMVVWDVDLTTEKIKFSSNCKEVLGHTWDDENFWWEAIHPEDVHKMQNAVEAAIVARSEFVQVVRLIRPDDGNLIWLENRGKIECDALGTACSIRGISLDVTERKQAEEALHAASRRKDEFLAMLAHELRNPLAPISTAAQILKLTAHLDPKRVQVTSDIIARQVDHMTNLVDDLLDVSRVTRGLVTLEKEIIEVQEIVAGAVEQVRPLIDARRHRFILNMPSEAVQIEGDRTRLIQVIANLLNNSAKYTPEDGEIELVVSTLSEHVNITVRDNGIGISAELLPHVFDLFTQAERSPDRAQGGLGLGLALVKSLVGLHGGNVTVASKGGGRGSTFSICLPRWQDASTQSGEDKRESDSPQPPRPKLNVMIVDDNVDAAHSLAMLLEAEGHHVCIEYEANRTLERARQSPPQVFLLDIGLPDIDGNELARRLRLMPETADAVLVAVTGYGGKEDREQSRAAGFDYHLVKPANKELLASILARVSGMRLSMG